MLSPTHMHAWSYDKHKANERNPVECKQNMLGEWSESTDHVRVFRIVLSRNICCLCLTTTTEIYAPITANYNHSSRPWCDRDGDRDTLLGFIFTRVLLSSNKCWSLSNRFKFEIYVRIDKFNSDTAVSGATFRNGHRTARVQRIFHRAKLRDRGSCPTSERKIVQRRPS